MNICKTFKAAGGCDKMARPGCIMANRVRFLIYVFVLIARAGLAAGTNDAVVSARVQPQAWIRTSADKTHFVCDGTGQRFVPWGFNYDRDDTGRLLEDYWADDWPKVADDFHEMKNLGANVVRIHLQLCRFMKSPDQPNMENLARLGKLVRLAEETEVYLDVTGLGCYLKQDVPAWYDAMDESNRWKVQARFWVAVAGVCKDSSAIFCYDLMNEPIPSGDKNSDWLPGQPLDGKYYVQRLTTDMRGRTEQEVAKEWITGICAAIRVVDTRHMITVGLVPWEETFGPGAKSAFCDTDVSASLDFLSVHYYPRQGKLADDLAILKHYDIGKPLVIEEIFPLSADAETTAEFIRRSRTDADGWISFYWGKTPEEYDKEPGVRASVVGNWLRQFCALREEMTGGAVPLTNWTHVPPPPIR
ncbi:MAG TPA: cellulase family glycosylhydrolase [Candidatus Sulfotelmatobacter sp.]|nr:cellulase family glycosylhydrolase [Candidatus Sulfotelmatobacter sp.]